MIKVRLIKLLKSTELAGNLGWLLMLLISCLSAANVFATSTSDHLLFEEQQQAQEHREAAKDLQTKKINSPSNMMEDGQNIIESNASKNTVRSEKILSNVQNNNTTDNANSSNKNIVNNTDSIKNTPKDAKTDGDILSPLGINEKEKIMLDNSSTNNSTAVEEKIHSIQYQKAARAPKTNIEVKSEDATADIPAPISNSTEKTAADKNNPNKHPTKPEVDNKTEKLTATTKPAAQKILVTEKAKRKTKKQPTKKSRVEMQDEEEQYSPEQLAQELNTLLTSTSNNLSNKRQSNQAGAIFFAENEQIRINLSNRDVNRLSVTDDKIQSINGPAGLYTAKNDPLGSAYLGINSDKSFTLFVSTIKGHQFSLHVMPIVAAGKTIVLTPSAPSRMTAQWEAAEGYQKVIVSFISSMINNEPLQDYAYVPAKKAKVYNFYGVAQIKPIGYYLGANLVGSVALIKNITREPLSIKPSSFYRKGVRAVALSDQTLAPKASGLLYQVINR